MLGDGKELLEVLFNKVSIFVEFISFSNLGSIQQIAS